ncbi:MAG: hypothetical protein M1812_006606 [Candelaria pacifica]|nr:MAG: hypothetical protein M1812_006606 [Candelaria pacifica]
MSDMIKTHQKHIVVIGAGVIGLQTAIFLLQAGYKVTILAKHLPGDFSPEYTSPWAGAQWRTHATTDQPTQCKWDLETYNYWKEMVEKEAADRAKGKNVPQSGLGIYESLNLWADPTPLITAPDKHLWFLPHVISPSTLPATSLPPGVGYGVAYTTFCIDPTVYLRNLQNIFLSFPNARIIRHTLPTNNGLPHALKTVQEDQSLKLGKVFLFVNASGLGSKTLAQDDSMYPTRGQTILVKGEAQKATTWLRENGSISYAVPRPGSGSTILGGSKQDHDW